MSLARFRCWINFHNWSMWSESRPVQYVRFKGDTGEKIDGSQFQIFKQERRCQDCRFIEVREVQR